MEGTIFPMRVKAKSWSREGFKNCKHLFSKMDKPWIFRNDTTFLFVPDKFLSPSFLKCRLGFLFSTVLAAETELGVGEVRFPQA